MEVELYDSPFVCKYRIDLFIQQQISSLYNRVQSHESYLFKPSMQLEMLQFHLYLHLDAVFS